MGLQSSDYKNIFLAGSSHTSFLFPSIKKCLKEKAIVSKLPYFAGTTAEVLYTLKDWPVEDKDVVHIYVGHRDLMMDENGKPFVGPLQFRDNMFRILEILNEKTNAKIVFSNIPPVSHGFLELDPQRNQKISEYNFIISSVTRDAKIPVHDFSAFVLSHYDNQDIYSDGLHFTLKFYRTYGMVLADFLIKFSL